MGFDFSAFWFRMGYVSEGCKVVGMLERLVRKPL